MAASGSDRLLGSRQGWLSREGNLEERPLTWARQVQYWERNTWDLRATSLLRREVTLCDLCCHCSCGARTPQPGGAAGRPQAPASVMRTPSHSLCHSFAGTNFKGDCPPISRRPRVGGYGSAACRVPPCELRSRLTAVQFPELSLGSRVGVGPH